MALVNLERVEYDWGPILNELGDNAARDKFHEEVKTLVGDDVYKLLKSKCFSCDRIRIHPGKIETYVRVLKLIKAGDMVTSQDLKTFFLYAA